MKTNTFFAFLENISRTSWKASAYHQWYAYHRLGTSDLDKANLIPKWMYDAIRLIGSQRPRMYGMPKTHKEDTPLRLILSITGSSNHELGKWFGSLLQSVLERFSSHCISDLLTFAKTMQNLDIDPDVLICFFNVSSLFTNFPFIKPSRSV